MRATVLVVALLAMAASGCAGYRFHLFPTAEIMVINDCSGSVLDIESLRGEHGVIRYGEKTRVVLEQFSGRDSSMVLTALDVSGYGRGSASRYFSVNQNGSREYYWSVNYLQGGVGCGRLR